jgi:hypothetical protein
MERECRTAPRPWPEILASRDGSQPVEDVVRQDIAPVALEDVRRETKIVADADGDAAGFAGPMRSSGMRLVEVASADLLAGDKCDAAGRKSGRRVGLRLKPIEQRRIRFFARRKAGQRTCLRDRPARVAAAYAVDHQQAADLVEQLLQMHNL